MSKVIIEIGKRKLHITETRVYWEGDRLNDGLDRPTLIQTNIKYYSWLNLFKKARYEIRLKNASNDLLEISYTEGIWPFGTKQGLPLFQYLLDQFHKFIFFELWEKQEQQWKDGQTVTMGDFEVDQDKLVKTQGNIRKSMAFKDMLIYDHWKFQLLVDQSNHTNTILIRSDQDWNSLAVETVLYEKKVPMEQVEDLSELVQYIGDEPWFKTELSMELAFKEAFTKQ